MLENNRILIRISKVLDEWFYGPSFLRIRRLKAGKVAKEGRKREKHQFKFFRYREYSYRVGAFARTDFSKLEDSRGKEVQRGIYTSRTGGNRRALKLVPFKFNHSVIETRIIFRDLGEKHRVICCDKLFFDMLAKVCQSHQLCHASHESRLEVIH